MKNRFDFYWPIFNVLGIILVLWSLAIIKVNPENNSKKEANLFDSTDHFMILQAEVKDARFFQHKQFKNASYPSPKEEKKLVIHF